jgi:hypothetical protein
VRLRDETGVVGTAVVDAGGSFSGFATLSNGPHVLHAVQIVQGTSSADSAPLSLTVGITAPVITSPAGPVSTFSHGLTVSGAGEPGAVVTLRDGALDIGTATVGGGGAFSVSVTLDYGVHVLSAVESDSGQTSGSSNAVTVTILVPAPSILSPADGDVVAPGIVRVSGTGVPGASIEILEGAARILLGNATVASDGTFSVPVTLGSGPRRRWPRSPA